MGNIQKSILATAPTLLGLGLVAYRISPSSQPAPPKPLIFAAPPIQPAAQQTQPADVTPIDHASGDALTRPTPPHWDPGPALDRMLLTVPTELDAHNTPPAPTEAARAPQATPPAFTPETAQARLPLTAFPQADKPDLERLDTPPTDQPLPDTPPARRNGWWPQQQALTGLPPMDLGGSGGPGGGGGAGGMPGGRGAGFGGRGRGHHRGRR